MVQTLVLEMIGESLLEEAEEAPQGEEGRGS